MGAYFVSVLGDSGLATFLIVANNKDQAKDLGLEASKDYFPNTEKLKITRVLEIRKPRVLALWDYKASWAIDELLDGVEEE